MARVPVPRTLDAPPRVFFFDVDYFFVAVAAFAVGTSFAAWWVGVTGAVLAVKGWARARAGGGTSKAFALLYWHLPFDLMRRVPASSRRHFTG